MVGEYLGPERKPPYLNPLPAYPEDPLDANHQRFKVLRDLGYPVFLLSVPASEVQDTTLYYAKEFFDWQRSVYPYFIQPSVTNPDFAKYLYPPNKDDEFNFCFNNSKAESELNRHPVKLSYLIGDANIRGIMSLIKGDTEPLVFSDVPLDKRVIRRALLAAVDRYRDIVRRGYPLVRYGGETDLEKDETRSIVQLVSELRKKNEEPLDDYGLRTLWVDYFSLLESHFPELGKMRTARGGSGIFPFA